MKNNNLKKLLLKAGIVALVNQPMAGKAELGGECSDGEKRSVLRSPSPTQEPFFQDLTREQEKNNLSKTLPPNYNCGPNLLCGPNVICPPPNHSCGPNRDCKH